MKKEIGKPKFEYKSFEVDKDVYDFIEENFREEMTEKCKNKIKKQEIITSQNYQKK